MFVVGRGRNDYLTGAVVEPIVGDPKIRNWRTENNLAMSWLMSSIIMEIGENFLLYSLAKEIWDAASEIFSTNDNTMELFHIESSLQDLCQADQSVIAFFSTLTRPWQQLDHFESHEWKCTNNAAYFKQIIETKWIFKFLMGLDKFLDEVCGQILSMKPLPNFERKIVKSQVTTNTTFMEQGATTDDSLGSKSTPDEKGIRNQWKKKLKKLHKYSEEKIEVSPPLKKLWRFSGANFSAISCAPTTPLVDGEIWRRGCASGVTESFAGDRSIALQQTREEDDAGVT
ncbi:hypothetical protein ZIOFF_051564 [Zingiber officinale]|uniref:Uncharacterized protein n=1 Tax=Zingiber officinale TaxID=94328 RepID=A0A8J5KHG2_ZINOF|nr:hypothetical protein ZIOFF_051564 [Zingiber officinale]